MGAGASADREDHEEKLLGVLGSYDSPAPNSKADFKSPTTNLFDTAAKQRMEVAQTRLHIQTTVQKGQTLLAAKHVANKMHKQHSHKKILVSPASSNTDSPTVDQRIETPVVDTPQSMGGSLRQSPRTVLAGKFGITPSPKAPGLQTSFASAMALSAFGDSQKPEVKRRTTFRALAKSVGTVARMSIRKNNNKKEDEAKMTIVEFDYDFDFDDNGILYYLGTQGYLLEWMNPTKVPLPIRCQRSSCG